MNKRLFKHKTRKKFKKVFLKLDLRSNEAKLRLNAFLISFRYLPMLYRLEN